MKLSFLAGALALLSSSVQAANPWAARHGLTSAQYQSTFNSLVGQGYRLNYVSGYTINNSPRYAAIWEKKPTAAWVAHHGMTSADYQNKFNTYAAQGYRPVLVNGYNVLGVDYYVAIWDKSAGGAWIARHGLTSSQYQTQFNTYVGQGYRLKHVSGYSIGSSARYAAIWEKSADTSAWIARHGMTSAQYQTEFNNIVGLGYRLSLVSGYQVGNTAYYAAIWKKSAGPAWYARHGMTSAVYQTETDNIVKQGYIPKVVSGYDQGQSDRYAALWTK